MASAWSFQDPYGRCGNSPYPVDLPPKSQDRLSLGALGRVRMGPEIVY